MPLGDGTGPRGKGPGTGRGLGRCLLGPISAKPIKSRPLLGGLFGNRRGNMNIFKLTGKPKVKR